MLRSRSHPRLINQTPGSGAQLCTPRTVHTREEPLSGLLSSQIGGCPGTKRWSADTGEPAGAPGTTPQRPPQCAGRTRLGPTGDSGPQIVSQQPLWVRNKTYWESSSSKNRYCLNLTRAYNV